MAHGYGAPVDASRRRIPLLAAMALFAGGLMLASCGGDGNDTATTETEPQASQPTTTETTTTMTTEPEVEKPTVVRVEVVNAAPEGGIVRETVSKGDRVVLVVTSDVADEVHLHGYDITRDVAAGGTARIAFQATLPGRFEVELEERGVPIADLTVEP
jgi:ABC-type glycerol-3-phosphate transport system substrate-binding protein